MTSELGADARALIEQACGEEAIPDARELERIRSNVVAGAAGTAALLVASQASSAVAAVKPSALVVAALKGAAIGTAVALGGFSLDRFVIHPAPERSVVSTPSTPVQVNAPIRPHVRAATTVAEPAASQPEQLDAPPPSSSAVATRASDAKRAVVDEERNDAAANFGGASAVSAALREEAALLGRVQQELRAQRGAEALRLLDASSTRLERGQLRQERLAAEVLAACQIGDLDRARRSIRAFLAENPATPSAARLRSSCVGSEFFTK